MENVLPFKDVFTSIVFVSVGMLLDIGFFLQHLPAVLGLALGLIVLKSIIILPVAQWVGYSKRTAFIAALSLAQIGEFSFVLAKNALSLNLLDSNSYQVFLAASILTMSLTPVFMHMAPIVACKIISR